MQSLFAALWVLQVMLDLLPFRSPADRAARWALAQEIASATDDWRERYVLARIAWFESGYSTAVARCRELGYPGNMSRGWFQVTPRTPSEQRAVCGPDKGQTALALAMIRRSAAACPNGEGPMSLAVYVSGRCDRGRKKAIERWGEEELPRLYLSAEDISGWAE